MELKDFTRGIAPKPKPVIQRPTGLNVQRSPYAPVTRAPVVTTAPTVQKESGIMQQYIGALTNQLNAQPKPSVGIPAVTPAVNMERPPAPVFPQALTGQALYNAQKAKDQNRVDESPMSGVTTQNKYNAFNATPAMTALRDSGLGYMYDAFNLEDTSNFATKQQLQQNLVDMGADALAVGMGASAGGLPGALGAGAFNFGLKGVDFASRYFDAPALMHTVGAGVFGAAAVSLVPAIAAFKRGDFLNAAKLAGPMAVTILKIGGTAALSDYIFKNTGIRAGDAIANLADVYPVTSLMKQYGNGGSLTEAFRNPNTNLPLALRDMTEEQINNYLQNLRGTRGAQVPAQSIGGFSVPELQHAARLKLIGRTTTARADAYARMYEAGEKFQYEPTAANEAELKAAKAAYYLARLDAQISENT